MTVAMQNSMEKDMAITLKIVEKAVVKKDLDFLAAKLAEKLQEFGWDRDDIAALAVKIADRLP
jgi:3-hydroxyisobutyrate dehydrogenase-like beta-hydroxyacid dehydrogenase